MNRVTRDESGYISLNCTEKLVTEYGLPKMPEDFALPVEVQVYIYIP